MFAVKTEILKELLKDKDFSIKLENAETMWEVELVLREFYRLKGFKVEEVETKCQKKRHT